MHINHSGFSTSQALRASLKRGLARQAIGHARLGEADLAALFAIACTARPNRKALERMAARLQRFSGVVRVTLASDGPSLVLIARNLRDVVTRVEAQDVFAETALIYTRVAIYCERSGVGFHLSRASFCLHALERLVERSPVALDRPLLATIDAEVTTLLRGLCRGAVIEDQGDWFAVARAPGVWAGSVDETVLEEDWNLAFVNDRARVPMFSARTFLSPEEMRPTTWLKWNADPTLQVAA